MKKQINKLSGWNNLMPKRQLKQKQKNYASQSWYVVGWILSQILIPQTLKGIEAFIEKSKRYSYKASQEINKSVLLLSNMISDQCSNIQKIEELKIKPTCFKVKLKGNSICSSNSMLKKSIMDMRGISRKQTNSLYNYSQLGNSINKNSLKKRTSIIHSLNENFLHPVIENINYVRNSFTTTQKLDGDNKPQFEKKHRKNFHFSENTNQYFYKIKSSETESQHLTTFKLKQKQFIDLENDDVIRIMRQKIFLKPQFCQNLGNIQKQSQKLQEGLTQSIIPQLQNKQNGVNTITRKKIEFKRSKQPQAKKCMFLTTDYNGNTISINKNDANRIYPHFIEMGTEVIEQAQISIIPSQSFKLKEALNKKSILFPKNANINQIISNLEQNKNNQDHNYKQIKTSDIQNSFTIKRVKKVPSSLHSDKREQQNNSNYYEDTETKKQVSQMKFFGGQYRPIKVSFDIFEKLKKNNWKIEQTKSKKQFQNIDEIHLQSNNPIDRKAVKKKYEISQKQNKNQEPSIKNLKRSFVTIGNTNALQFLFNEQKKYKKTVTIHQNF